MFKILDKFGGEVTANEQAIFNRISTNNSSGYVKGYLNSLGISKLTSNAIGIDSGLLSIQGFRFVNSALITHTVNVTPSHAIAFQLIAVFSHYVSSENDALEIITRPIEELRQENLYSGSNAVYELELARFTMTSAGIMDFAATLEQLTYNDQDFTEVLEKVDNAESDSEAALKAANLANSNATAAVNTANSAASMANLAKTASDTATAKVAELSEQIGEKQGTTVKINGVAQASVELTTATVGKALESNNNLLQNGDFTLNTQGQSSYPSDGYSYNETVDGWLAVDSGSRTGTIYVIPGGGIKITATGLSFGIRQGLDFVGAGKTYTLTIKVSAVDGNTTPLAVYIRNSNYTVIYNSVKITEAGTYTITGTVPTNETNKFVVYLAVEGATFTSTCSYTIDWVKLEEGSISTAPNGLVQNATRALYANKASEADNSKKLNGKAASDIFESDGVTAKKATSLIPDENGAVNPGGRKNLAVGRYSVAFGSNSSASGIGSTALGYYASASGEGSVAACREASSAGYHSTALGYHSSASGGNSTALGDNSSASGIASIALGMSASTAETDTNTMQLGSDLLSVLRSKVNLTVTSDERDKTDISDITNALAFLEKLNPVTFVSNDRANYISESDKESENYRKYGMCEYDRIAHAAGTKKGERRRCGLLAQEVIEAMQSVYGTDNYANIVNDNFHDLTEKPSDVENKYTLAYANLVPFLIGAIKELNAKIKELEDKQC